ncbi:calcium-binding protein [Planktotalea sp.]|uniref:calcium-binding protein n=1 Tax=Planktotalea sp. TaxID=2029877 RepID=UPI003F6C0279
MTELTVINTWALGPVTHRMNLRDLDLVATSSDTVLYATNGSTGGIVNFGVNANTGALSYRDAITLPHLASVDGSAHLEQTRFGGQDYIVNLGRHADGLEAIQIGSGSNLDMRVDLAGTDDANISSLVFHSADTRDVAYASYWGSSDLGIYQLSATGAMSLLGTVKGQFESQGADLLGFQVTEAHGQDVLVFASQEQDTVFSYTINANGGLAIADLIRMSDGLPVATPTAMEIIENGGQRFAVLASSGTSSLTVMQISATGELTPTDHINGSLHTRIENVIALETVSYADRHFVIAGGANDGISLFQLLPDGRLYHLDAQADLLGASLSNVTAITAQVRGTGIDIYAASENEAGLTQLRYELGAQAATQRGTSGDDLLNGNGAGDYLIGHGGDDTLHGGNGNDLILDGAGADVMTGGNGADIFILARDGERDDILDFDPGQDRMDLSGWGRLYHVSGLEWSERSNGAVIRYGEEVLIVRTADNTPLKSTDIPAHEMFNLTHTDLSYMIGGTDPLADHTQPGNFEGSAGNDTLNGTDFDDVIRGNLGDDSLTGGDGDDVLNGGVGADTLDGGAGSDWVSYEGSRGSLRVDLMFSQINTNVAAGDIYHAIENLIGSQGFDNLRGTLSENHIQGGRNVDYIFGRRGDDTLDGGIGNDVLFGGAGRDVLIGGENRDRAQYSESLTAVLVDLERAFLNTGEAAGDSFDSIEDLAGGRFDDDLYGDAFANRLFGREGADDLLGREGNDYLNGGAHNDTLDGGAGNDILRGGQHADTFVFREGNDVIEDFVDDVDEIELATALLGGGAITAGRALEFANVVAGNIFFDFGEEGQLTLLNFTDPSALLDDISFV